MIGTPPKPVMYPSVAKKLAFAGLVVSFFVVGLFIKTGIDAIIPDTDSIINRVLTVGFGICSLLVLGRYFDSLVDRQIDKNNAFLRYWEEYQREEDRLTNLVSTLPEGLELEQARKDLYALKEIKKQYDLRYNKQ